MTANQQDEVDARLCDAFGEQLPDTTRIELRVRTRIANERYRHRVAFVACIAAALVTIVLGYWMVQRQHTARLLTDAAHDHQVEVVEHKARRWRSSRDELAILTARFNLPDTALAAFAPLGYHLEYAKTCGLDGLAVLHLVYTSGSQKFSVYVPRRNYSLLPTGAESVGAERIAAVQTKGLAALIVTDGKGADCFALARQFKSSI